MKPNPGGQLAVDCIVGRDDFIRSMWEILEGRSIYMNDVRRVGKTQILRKMEADPPKDWFAVKRDLGGQHSAAEFATCVYKDSDGIFQGKSKAARRMKNMIESLQGFEIGGVIKLPDGSTAPWKDILNNTFADLNDELNRQGKNLVFLWDEVPFLLDNVKKREKAETAMEILDVLRALGQDYTQIRLVLTGSVGLHHILKELKKGGYLGSPLNTMERKAPGPLGSADARELAESLLRGAKLACNDINKCAQQIADSVGNVPFYIHKLISRLPKSETISPELTEQKLQCEITLPDDDWDLPHFRSRIPLYYESDDHYALEILDAIAGVDSPISFKELADKVIEDGQLKDEEKLRELLKLLQQDHYLERDLEGRYAFRYQLIRRWWRFDRSL